MEIKNNFCIFVKKDMDKVVLIFNDESYEGNVIAENNNYRLIKMGYCPILHEINEDFIKQFFPDFKQDNYDRIDNLFILNEKIELMEPSNTEYYSEDFIEPIDIIGSDEFIKNEKEPL